MITSIHITDLNFSLHDPQIKSELLEFNAKLGECVTEYKNMIDPYFEKRNCWDQVKKFSNDYEFIFTSLQKQPCVANVNPSSRSYFKLWEILKQHGGLGMLGASDEIKTAHIAEGPGGFVECIQDWCSKHVPYKRVESHGITLRSKDRMVPNWKLSKSRLARGIQLHGGADGTGDIYNILNIEHFVRHVGEGTCDIITADGGFDIHGNFNNQENMIERLLISEIYAAIYTCKIGGSFVLKVFDFFCEATMQLLWILKIAFADLHILKPLSSRPANSEKYIVACGFKGRQITELVDPLDHMWHYINSGGKTRFHIEVPCDIMLHVSNYNRQYCFRQMYYICKTVAFIDIIYNKKQKEFCENVVRRQYNLCKEWCIKNDIPYQRNDGFEYA